MTTVYKGIEITPFQRGDLWGARYTLNDTEVTIEPYTSAAYYAINKAKANIARALPREAR